MSWSPTTQSLGRKQPSVNSGRCGVSVALAWRRHGGSCWKRRSRSGGWRWRSGSEPWYGGDKGLGLFRSVFETLECVSLHVRGVYYCMDSLKCGWDLSDRTESANSNTRKLHCSFDYQVCLTAQNLFLFSSGELVLTEGAGWLYMNERERYSGKSLKFEQFHTFIGPYVMGGAFSLLVTC